ncbi:protein NRT1/ PTR FAMILY 5.11-like [Salvia miltiorrhiza]|uniref:protein NRT1/ PTR FAMILY 5.11-like n=1 Tax=Salvia miltiorrhiza TaxID=226208 RepID=UPI0025AC5C10|nr:protein NRT1/ PTR FAMILY 5.11-like [Salvia miltiorrhiza]
MRHIQVLELCREKFGYYVVFTPSIFFILGLILSYKLVEKTFLSILITRLNDAWEEYDLRSAVVVVNLQEGTSAVLVPVFTYVAEVYTGRFLMLFFSTTLCIIGLLLNYVAVGNDDSGQLELQLFYPALGLMTLAEAAQTVTLQAFLDDQFRPMDLGKDRRLGCTKFWWILVSFVAAIFAQFGPLTGFHSRKLALVLMGLMGGCFLVFLLGKKCYHNVLTIQNHPFKQVGNVIARAIANRNLDYTLTTQPRVPWLRWLDRAAEAGSVEQVRKVKLLLMMLPLWSSFLTLSLVSASGTTFFYDEATSLTEDNCAILFLHNLMRFTTFAVSETSSYVVGKLEEKKQYNQQKMEVVRIGIGMWCCVPCCLAAWVTATRRQHDTINVYWLTPQYFLLGLMSGLSEDGLESFYESQVFESLSTFGPPFGELVMGLGKFMSILCVLIFSTRRFEWFQSDIGNSSLNKYYILLVVLSFVNAVIYCLVVCWYKDDAFLVEDEENGSFPQQVGDQIQLLDSVAPRSIEGRKEKSSCADTISEPSRNEVEVEKEEAMGIASSIEGQRISRRTVSKPRESSSRDVITESSSSRQEEEEEEEAEDVLRRAVNKFRRLASRAARRRFDSTLSKNE